MDSTDLFDKGPLLDAGNSSQENTSEYTGDGSVCISGHPASRKLTGKWKASSLTIVCSFCCFLAYSSIAKNLVSYLTKVLHETNVAAARNVATWQGTSYLTPLIGAFVADSYLGKYQTALISCTIFIAGMMMLLLSVALPLISTGPHTWTVWSDPVSSQYIFFTWTVWSGMVSAALVESNRLQIAQAEGLVHHKVAVPMSILWQGPQYFLQGVAEVFSNIGLTEFFYDESPDAMRSLCMAFSLANVSAGSYLSSFILSLVPVFTARGGSPGWIPDNLNEGHLDRFYLMMAGLSLLNILVFAFFATRYKCKKAS